MNAANIPSKRPNTKKTEHQLPAAALAIYPTILVLGSLFSLISPTARPPRPAVSSAPNGAVTEENREPGGPINYFAGKDNIFNVYFVKIGWIWTTAAFLSLVWAFPAFNSRRFDVNCRIRRVWQVLFRYALVTVSWILTTQWCFGPAVIDRSFVSTGGKCHSPPAGDTAAVIPDWDTVVTAVSCRAHGGSWRGGHDVSGHVFMLVIASASLVFELAGSLCPADNEPETKEKDGDTRVSASDTGDTQCESTKWARHLVIGVICLSLWMLLMTGIWFHTWLEKMSGLVIGLGTVYAVYILPRTLESWKNIVGLPGV